MDGQTEPSWMESTVSLDTMYTRWSLVPLLSSSSSNIPPPGPSVTMGDAAPMVTFSDPRLVAHLRLPATVEHNMEMEAASKEMMAICLRVLHPATDDIDGSEVTNERTYAGPPQRIARVGCVPFMSMANRAGKVTLSDGLPSQSRSEPTYT